MSGILRHRMDVYKETAADGSDDPSFTLYRTGIPCNMVPTSGMETYRGRKLEARINYVVETRWHRDYLPNMKLKDVNTGKTLQIESAIERDGRRVWHDLFATEVVSL